MCINFKELSVLLILDCFTLTVSPDDLISHKLKTFYLFLTKAIDF